ncbi:hypothetical protein [Duganella sp. S19_KUP01_CR8]|uniref:hypothetical protein n=1 Tax=Duganella sp. S19_KUP01_CR8 TaxID=3025502 RepID=UPI002FCDD82A
MKPWLLVGLLAGLAYYFWPGDEHPATSLTARREATAPAAGAPAHAAEVQTASGATNWLMSPFGRGAASEIDQAKLLEERKLRMKQGGYFTPEEYFSLPLAELNRRAKAGDLYAMLQLAQQYYYESAALQSSDGFDTEANPKELGRQYFADAAVAGHIQIIAVLVQLYDAEGDAGKAYAWELFAGQMGLKLAGGHDPDQLSPQARAEAQQLAGKLFAKASQPTAALLPYAGGGQ